MTDTQWKMSQDSKVQLSKMLMSGKIDAVEDLKTGKLYIHIDKKYNVSLAYKAHGIEICALDAGYISPGDSMTIESDIPMVKISL